MDHAVLMTISNFNFRMTQGPALNEFEHQLYEQLCRQQSARAEYDRIAVEVRIAEWRANNPNEE